MLWAINNSPKPETLNPKPSTTAGHASANGDALTSTAELRHRRGQLVHIRIEGLGVQGFGV